MFNGKTEPRRIGPAAQWRAVIAGAALLLSGGAYAQAAGPGALHVTSSATIDFPLLVLPNRPDATGDASAGGWSLSATEENGFRVYRASRGGRAYSMRVALSGPQRHVAFNPVARRFETLALNVRVELRDFGGLGRVVSAAGGTGGKAYPMLGFALVHLPAGADPAAAAQTIAGLPGVVSARLMVRGPKRKPR